MYASQIPHRTIVIQDQEYLFFGGTGYLGMHARSKFGDLVKKGLDLYGSNYGASRLGFELPVILAAEEKLTSWIGAPSGVLVSSGTLAGRLILEVLGDEYMYHYTPNSHVAINPSHGTFRPGIF